MEFIYTFCLNTDGISLCSKSNLTIWPVYLTINEIDRKCRFSPDLVLLAGKFYIDIKLFWNLSYFIFSLMK